MSGNIWLDWMQWVPWTWALFAVLLFYATWAGYLAIMHLKTTRDRGQLTGTAKIIAYPLLAVFVVLDVVLNLLLGTLIFLEPPREFLFTTRVSRLNDSKSWRGAVARWMCSELLDVFDPSGRHCR